MTVSDAPRLWLLPRPVLWGARVATWLIVAGVLVLSLLPGSLMPSIGRGLAEHFIAYTVFATAAALGYGRRFGYLLLFAIAVALAGLFEFAQMLLPQRQLSALDFWAGALGAGLGVSLAHLIRTLVGRPPQ